MQQLSVLSGPVSEVKEKPVVGGEIIRFRIANRPVYTDLPANLANDDAVKAVGYERGEFFIVALRNQSTQTVYEPPVPSTSVGLFGIIVGICLIPLWGVGFFILWLIWQNHGGLVKKKAFILEAKRLLEAA